MLDRLSLKLKLLLLSVLALGALVITVVTGTVGIHSGITGVEVLGHQVMPSVLALQKLKEFQIAQRSSTYEIALWENDTEAQDQFADIAKEKQALWQQIDQVWKQYAALPKSSAEAALWAKFEPEWKAWREVDEKIVALAQSLAANKDPAVQQQFFQQYLTLGSEQRTHYLAAGKALNQVVDYNTRIAASETDKSEAATLWARRLMLALGVTAIVVVGLLTLLVSRSILRQMGGDPALAAQVAKRIASGDLTAPIALADGDQTSLMANLSEMQTQLRALISQVLQSADQLFVSASGLGQDVRTLLGNAQQESRAADETASAVDSIANQVVQVGTAAETARSLSQQAGQYSVEGCAVVTRATAEMNQVADAVRASSDLVRKLGECSEQISGIVNVIKEIADQTNLLALNAAIEAARAGEQGRGFAVVADEVRKLSERTAHSTGEISAMIGTIQSGVENAVKSMGGAEASVISGVSMVRETTAKMESIEVGATTASEAVVRITDSLQESKRNLHAIEGQVESIVGMIKQNIDSVDHMAHSTENINELARRLTSAVHQFRL